MRKIIFVFLFTVNYLFAICYYIPCAPSVAAATAIAATNLEKSFLKVNYQLNTTRNLYGEYATALQMNNTAYKENFFLKAKYLETLEEISHIQEQIIELKKANKKER